MKESLPDIVLLLEVDRTATASSASNKSRPDTKAATVVSFARPAAPDESSKGAALPMNFDDFVPASTSAPAPTTAV